MLLEVCAHKVGLDQFCALCKQHGDLVSSKGNSTMPPKPSHCDKCGTEDCECCTSYETCDCSAAAPAIGRGPKDPQGNYYWGKK
jgi:hypothetical protein